MKRSSIKKSSTFKIQAEKNVFKNYLEDLQNSQTARDYPHLLQLIRKTSQTVYDFCYSYSEESPFLRGLNYNFKNYGFSILQNIVTYREWIPGVEEVYLMGEFNEFNETSHKLEPVEDEYGMYRIQIDTNVDRIKEEQRLLLRVIDEEGKENKFCPPSCYITSGNYGIYSIHNGVPSHFKKPLNTMLAYTIDFDTIPLEMGEEFLQKQLKTLEHFNVIILRNIFAKKGSLLDRSRMDLERMKLFRDIVNKIKNQLGLKVILEWSLETGGKKYDSNPFQNEILTIQQNNQYQYNLNKKDVMAIYMANLAYYITYFAVDGYHFKHIDEFCEKQNGQILMKCINILNQRLSEGGLTLASSKKEVPGLNQPILEGGLGFTFTYNYDTNLLLSQNHKELKQKFNKILVSSNCMSINFENLSSSHLLNLFFAFFSSKKGVFCKGNFKEIRQILCKILSIRKKSQLFNPKVEIVEVSQTQIIIKRWLVWMLFNFGEEEEKFVMQRKVEVLYSSVEEKVREEGENIVIGGQQCCIVESEEMME